MSESKVKRITIHVEWEDGKTARCEAVHTDTNHVEFVTSTEVGPLTLSPSDFIANIVTRNRTSMTGNSVEWTVTTPAPTT